MKIHRPAHHFIFVHGTEEHASGSPIKLVVVEAGPAHCGSVYNWGHLCEVVKQDLVEQGLIAILQHCPD